MSAPLSPFGEAFRAHVIPRLRPAILALARSDGMAGEDMDGAHDAVMREAARFGASLLSPAEFAQFDAWVSTTLLAEFIRGTEALDAARQTKRARMTPAQVRVAADLAEHFAAWEAADVSEPV